MKIKSRTKEGNLDIDQKVWHYPWRSKSSENKVIYTRA